MKNIHDLLLLVAALVCCIMISLLNGEPVPVIAIVTVTYSFAASGEPAISVGIEVLPFYIPREFGGIDNPAIVKQTAFINNQTIHKT